MRWERKGNYHSESDEGYVISATRDGKGGWRFTAWGPVSEEWKKINQYLRSSAGGEPPPPLKVRYAIGETVPQPRELIGVYPDSAQATKACNTHREKKNSVSSRAAK